MSARGACREGRPARDQLAEARPASNALDGLATRLVSIYKTGETNEVDVLLDADGFDDLATRAELLGRIQAADRALAERVRDLRTAIADQWPASSARRRARPGDNERVDTARAEFAAVRADAEAEAAALADARAAQIAALDAFRPRWRAGRTASRSSSRSRPWRRRRGRRGSRTGPWAIPEAIVMCESGGNQALNPSSGAGGAYQILPSTWARVRRPRLPHQASPAEQDAIAAQIWAIGRVPGSAG